MPLTIIFEDQSLRVQADVLVKPHRMILKGIGSLCKLLQKDTPFFVPRVLGKVRYSLYMPLENEAENKHINYDDLSSWYTNCLQISYDNGYRSVIIPLIAVDKGALNVDDKTVARESIENFLQHHDMDVYITALSRESLYKNDTSVRSLRDYIAHHYDDRLEGIRYSVKFDKVSTPQQSSDESEEADTNVITYHHGDICQSSPALSDRLQRLESPFSVQLMHFIHTKGKNEVEIYKKANIDRKLFSKIRSNDDYTPSRHTCLALAIALELDIEEVNILLKSAGFALSNSYKSDVIVQFFIEQKNYNIFEINEALFYYDQTTLGK
ncbi:MAG: RNase III inhibitor [Pseudomonadota bacterium]